MNRTLILDEYRRPIGWIEREDGLGRVRILRHDLSVAGYVDRRRGVTVDASYRIVARGDVPGLLLR
jgi:hypothetical protein